MADTSAYVAWRDNKMEAWRQVHHESVRDELTPAQLLRAKCQDYSEGLAKAFPELKAVSGFFCAVEPEPDDRQPGAEHWWCVHDDGTIYDPTVEQFGVTTGIYVPWRRDFHHVRIGCCMACGMEIYGLAGTGSKCVCPDNDECHEILQREYSTE